MSGKQELESLRSTLGRGPTDMLLWLASKGCWAPQCTPRIVRVSAARIRRYRRKLESAGLIRTTLYPYYGYEYDIVRPEDLPMLFLALEEWQRERGEARHQVEGYAVR